MPRIIDAEIVLPYLEIGYREQQADWAETDPNKVSYIKNKPVIPDAQINSDWAENDTTKKSHILNRTHYREFNISSYSENINLHVSGSQSTGSVYGYNQYPAGFMQKFKEGNSFSFTLGNDTFNGDIHQRGYFSAFYVGNIHLHIPDLPDTGEDWCVYSDLLGQDSLHFIVDDSYTGSYSLEMNIYEATYHQLDENYIPDTIARVSQIELLDGNATIASETNDIVTIKGGVKQEDGLISNSSANDITLSKVAKTGDYADLANTPDIASIADGEIAIHNTDSDAHNGVDGRVSTIEGVIPSQTYDEGNELADKTFVNSSIATNTATFKGTFNLVSDLNLSTSSTQAQIGTALGNAISQEDNNDYCFVLIPTSDLTPTEIAQVDRYKYNGTAWDYEYTLNNSGYTAAQWASINSGATSANIGQIATNTQDISDNADAIAQNTADINVNFPYIGTSTGWGSTAGECYLRTSYFKNGIVPQKKGDLVFSQGTRNFHRCGNLVWDAGQGCYKTTPTFLFHLGEDNINPNWSQADSTKKDYIKNKPTTLSGYGITDAKIESETITLGSNTITPLTQHQDISGKADKVASATNGNFAGLDSNGNLTDSGKKAGDFKTKQTAVVDPAATTDTGLSITAIDSISQNENGVITPTKKTVTIQDSSTSQKGVVQLSNSYNGTSETKAVTEKALSDGLATKQASGSYKTTQTPVTDPTASGTSTTAITNITQDANGVIVPTKKTITDTKNTAGSTDTSSKIYLVGATSQAANPQTYSDNEVYAQNGLLEAKEVQVNEAAKLVWDSTNQCMRITFN